MKLAENHLSPLKYEQPISQSEHCADFTSTQCELTNACLPLVPAQSETSTNLICLTKSKSVQTDPILRPGAPTVSGESNPYWLDIRVQALMPGTNSKSPQEERARVIEIAREELAKTGHTFDEESVCILNVREFIGHDSEPTKVRKTKLYIVLHPDSVVTVREGDGDCIKKVLADVHKNPNVAPISLAFEIIKSTIEPLDNVIASFDRHQNRLLEHNIEKNGLNEEDLKSLPQFAQTISYVSQRLMAMDTAIRYFDAYIEKLDGSIEESLRKKIPSQLSLLSGALGIYEKRCEALLNNIELLQDSMQIATQLESNRKNQMLSNRFTILAGGLGPVGIGLGFIQAYAITGTLAHTIFATSLVCGALLIAFRNCNIPWLDGPE